MKKFGLLGFLPLLVMALIVSGCGNKAEPKVSTQVAAKVNADEITVYQVNNILSRAQALTPEMIVKARSDVLEKLIDQQLAKQQALALNLDRTPQVVQAIEAAHNEILARAYLDTIAANQTKPSAVDVKNYYAAHPELFTQRRVYNMEQLALEPKDGIGAELRKQVSIARSINDIVGWLKNHDIKFSVNQAVRPAETLPMEYLPALQTLKDGEMRIIGADDSRLVVVHLIASNMVPVDEATANPRIEQFLYRQKVSSALADNIKSLRDKADITYSGEFVRGADTAQTKVKKNPAKSGMETDAAAASAGSKIAMPPKSVELGPENVERGLRGLN